MREERLEVKRQSRRGLGDRLLDNLHWFAAWGAIGAVAAQGAGLWLAPAHGPEGVADAEAAYVRFDDSANLASFPGPERLKEVESTLAALSQAMAPAAVPEVSAPRGLTYPPAFLETLKPGAANEIRFAAPVDLRVSAEVGGVDLAWTDPAGNNVRIKEFEVLRGAEDGAAETVVKTVPGDVFTTRDGTAEAGRTYRYRVRAVAADTTASTGGAAKSAPSEGAVVKAIADFKIEAVGLKGEALVVKVSKWSGGAWRDRNFEVRQGDAVGGRDDALGLDFSTGRRVKSLRIETKTAPVVRREVIFDAEGRVVVEGGAPRRVSVTREETFQVATATLEGGSMPADTLTWGGR
jgi:hypothetical protein